MSRLIPPTNLLFAACQRFGARFLKRVTLVKEMSISLDYESRAAIEENIRLDIRRDAAIAFAAHDWWAEGINFFEDKDRPGFLCGSTKLFLSRGYHPRDGSYREVPHHHDVVMAYVDGLFILRTLRRWSKQYRVDWRLSMEGNYLTSISAGRLPWTHSLALCAAGLAVRFYGRAPLIGWQVRRLRLRYSDRWD